MFRRVLVAVAAVLFAISPWFNRTASAQDTLLDQGEASMLFVTSNVAPADAPATGGPQIPFNILNGRPQSRASRLLLPLYASTAMMQVLDVDSTMLAMKNGALEGNPMMAGLRSQKPAFVAEGRDCRDVDSRREESCQTQQAGGRRDSHRHQLGLCDRRLAQLQARERPAVVG